MRLLVALAVLLIGCSGPAPARRWKPPPSLVTPPPLRITWDRVRTPADVPATPPRAGTWRIHLIDVGTGLAILLQGHDFAMLYDAGTNDRGETPLRVLAYLGAALGPSGDDLCVAKGAAAPTARSAIDHVVLSHPHLDHASALDLVLHCHDVAEIWDSGRVNDTVFYRDFLTAVGRTRATYHTAAPPADDRTVRVKDIDVTIPRTVTWETFSEGDQVALGDGARFTILHAEAKAPKDPNQNSIVLAVELGTVRLILTGDAESGERADPDAPLGDVEEHVVDHFARELDADILQVGHHGSKTSSRRGFLAAVSPSLALISAGPKKYGSVTLPDAEVIEALEQIGATVLRTDLHDDACDLAARLGPPEGPGGCDSYIVTIAPGD